MLADDYVEFLLLLHYNRQMATMQKSIRRQAFSKGFLIYAYLAGIAGFILLIWLTPRSGRLYSIPLAVFLLAMQVIVDIFLLPLAKRFTISLRASFDYAGVLFLGPVWAAWLNCISLIPYSLNEMRRRQPHTVIEMPSVLLANMGASIVTTLGGGFAYLALEGQVPFGHLSVAIIPPLLLLFLVTEIITSGNVSLASYLAGQERKERLYTLSRSLLVNFSAIPVAVSAALLYHEFRLPGLFIGAIPFVFAVVLFQRLGKARETLRKRVMELEILNQVGQAISSSLDLNQLVELIYVETGKILDVHNFTIALYDERKNHLLLMLKVVEGVRQPPAEVPLEAGFMNWILKTGKPLLIKDYLEEKDTLPVEAISPERIHSYLGVPMLSGEKSVGVISIFSSEINVFHQEHLQLLQTIAGQAAVAVENARLFETARREIEERKTLYEIGTTIGSSLDLMQVLNLIIDSIKKAVPYDAAGFFLIQRSSNEIEANVERGYPPGIHDLVGLKIGKGLVGTVAKEGKPLIVPDVSKDPRYVMARPQTMSEIIVPLVSKEKVIGVINLESDQLAFFTEAELELLLSFASQAAIAIENARLYQEIKETKHLEDELVIAREIQMSFLPEKDPTYPGYEITGTAIPSEQVGGDYYDFIPIADGQLGIVIGDVSGKGVPAALIMASFRASLIAEIRNNYSISTILSKVNALLYESTESTSFVTAVYGVLDTKNKILTYSNAGHNYPLWIRASGEFLELKTGGTILGTFEHSSYSEERLEIKQGDILVFYTDGIIDAQNKNGDFFGENRLKDLIRTNTHRTALEIRNIILSAVKDFVHGASQFDDMTLIVVGVRS